MLTRLLHRIVARPRVYDLVQFLAGASKVRGRLARQIAGLGALGLVVDIGGGTGAGRGLIPARSTYVCLDIDPLKVQGFRRKNPGEWAVVADASRAPLPDASAGAVLCVLMAHHLPPEVFERFLREAGRVLKPGGHLVFVDPVWKPTRWPGRFLWRYDRGSFPRTAAALREALGGTFDVAHWEQFAFFHAYALCVARKRGQDVEPGPPDRALNLP